MCVLVSIAAVTNSLNSQRLQQQRHLSHCVTGSICCSGLAPPISSLQDTGSRSSPVLDLKVGEKSRRAGRSFHSVS